MVEFLITAEVIDDVNISPVPNKSLVKKSLNRVKLPAL